MKQSAIAATCSGLGDSQAKSSCESTLAVVNAMPGASKQEVRELGVH